MKNFYEMMQILESEGGFTPNEKAGYEQIGKALKSAGLQWDEDEGKVLYGKWADMTLRVGTGERRVKGVILPDAVRHEVDPEYGGGSDFVGYKINGTDFHIRDIIEIHEMKAHTSYDNLWGQYLDMEKEQWDGRPRPGTYSFDNAEQMRGPWDIRGLR